MRIFVSGYWYKNLGDDLFLKVFCDHYSQHDIYIYKTRGSDTVKNISNLHLINNKTSLLTKIMDYLNKKTNLVLPYSSSYSKFRSIKKNDIDIYCELGGSIFILPNNGEMDSAFYERKYLQKKLKVEKIPYFVVGSNFGPYYSKKQILNYTNFFNAIDGISFRDKFSYNLFNENVKKIQYFPDVVANLKISEYKLENEFVLISIINPSKKLHSSSMDSIYFEYICALVKKILAKNKNVVLMSFCEYEGDLEFAKKIKKSFNSDKIMIYNYTNIYDALKTIAKAEKIIASRYHAMILAWLLRKPTFIISYSDKIINVINEYFPEQAYVKLNEINSKAMVNPIFSVNKSIRNLALEAQKQFNFIDHYIGRHNE